MVAILVAASILPLNPATAQDSSGDTITLNLQNVDIHSLIETVSVHTGRNFIIDPRVKGTVNVVSSTPVNADRLYEIFLSALEINGLAAVPAGKFTKIVPSPVGVHSAVPLISERSDSGDELVSRVIQLERMPATQIVKTLRPLLSAPASVTAESASNTIIITDRAATIEKLIDLIGLMDR